MTLTFKIFDEENDKRSSKCIPSIVYVWDFPKVILDSRTLP